MTPLLTAILAKFNTTLVPGTFAQPLYFDHLPSIDAADDSTGQTTLEYPYCRYVQIPGGKINYGFLSRVMENPVIQFDVFDNTGAQALAGCEAVATVFDPTPGQSFVGLNLSSGSMRSMLRQREPLTLYDGKDQNGDDVYHSLIRYDISVQTS